MHLMSQMTACLSGITDWAEQSLTKHSIPALGEQEIWGEVRNVHCQKEKRPILLSWRQDLKPCARVRKGWNKNNFIKKIKRKGKKKNNLSKNTLLPWNPSQLYKKPLQQANSSARQLWELHTQLTTNLSSNHHLQCYSKKDLLKICKLKIILFIILRWPKALSYPRGEAMRLGNNMRRKKQPRKYKQQQNPTQKPNLSLTSKPNTPQARWHTTGKYRQSREHKAKGEAQTHPPGRDTQRKWGYRLTKTRWNQIKDIQVLPSHLIL